MAASTYFYMEAQRCLYKPPFLHIIVVLKSCPGLLLFWIWSLIPLHTYIFPLVWMHAYWRWGVYLSDRFGFNGHTQLVAVRLKTGLLRKFQSNTEVINICERVVFRADDCLHNTMFGVTFSTSPKHNHIINLLFSLNNGPMGSIRLALYSYMYRWEN